MKELGSRVSVYLVVKPGQDFFADLQIDVSVPSVPHQGTVVGLPTDMVLVKDGLVDLCF